MTQKSLSCFSSFSKHTSNVVSSRRTITRADSNLNNIYINWIVYVMRIWVSFDDVSLHKIRVFCLFQLYDLANCMIFISFCGMIRIKKNILLCVLAGPAIQNFTPVFSCFGGRNLHFDVERWYMSRVYFWGSFQRSRGWILEHTLT